METIIKILMERDGVSRREAKEMIQECLDEINSGNYDAIAEVLGLEDDYIYYLV